jgi:hypothetical protein
LRGIFGVEVGTKRTCRSRALDSQHGTGGEGSLNHCTQGYYPKEGILL